MSWIEKKIGPSIVLIKELLDLKECKAKGISFFDGKDIAVQKRDKAFDLVFDTH